MFMYWYIIVFICFEYIIVIYKYINLFILLNKGMFIFVIFEIFKIFYFYLNKILFLFWILELDVLWYLIFFYKMWVYLIWFLNEYKDIIWFVVWGWRGIFLFKCLINICFEFFIVNNNCIRFDLLNIEVLFCVENVFCVVMLFGFLSFVEVL